jgi:hypothetical protein
LTKRLFSLVDNSQDSCKKVPSAKNALTDQSSERPTGVKVKGKEHRVWSMEHRAEGMEHGATG